MMWSDVQVWATAPTMTMIWVQRPNFCTWNSRSFKTSLMRTYSNMRNKHKYTYSEHTFDKQAWELWSVYTVGHLCSGQHINFNVIVITVSKIWNFRMKKIRGPLENKCKCNYGNKTQASIPKCLKKSPKCIVIISN